MQRIGTQILCALRKDYQILPVLEHIHHGAPGSQLAFLPVAIRPDCSIQVEKCSIHRLQRLFPYQNDTMGLHRLARAGRIQTAKVVYRKYRVGGNARPLV